MNKISVVFVLTIFWFHSTCTPAKVVHKNRSINSVVAWWCLWKKGICECFCEVSWLRFGIQKKLPCSLTQTNTNSIYARDFFSWLHSFHSGTASTWGLHSHRFSSAKMLERNNTIFIFSLSVFIWKENFTAFRYHSRCVQFARKLRWFLLASFINSFYQLHKGTKKIFHSNRISLIPGRMCVVISWKIIQCNSWICFAQWTVRVKFKSR